MKIDIVSVFPEYFEVLNLSLLGKAQEKGLVEVTAHNLRDWTHDVHHSVDDTPVGGGAGMVMKPEVWSECLDELLHLEPTTVTCDSTADADDTASADTAEPAESATEIAANADTVPATDRQWLQKSLRLRRGKCGFWNSRIPFRHRTGSGCKKAFACGGENAVDFCGKESYDKPVKRQKKERSS